MSHFEETYFLCLFIPSWFPFFFFKIYFQIKQFCCFWCLTISYMHVLYSGYFPFPFSIFYLPSYPPSSLVWSRFPGLWHLVLFCAYLMRSVCVTIRLELSFHAYWGCGYWRQWYHCSLKTAVLRSSAGRGRAHWGPPLTMSDFWWSRSFSDP